LRVWGLPNARFRVHTACPSAGSESQFKNNHFTEMCSGSEVGSYLRLIDSCITQVKAQGPSRPCDASKEEEEGYQTHASASTQRAPREAPSPRANPEQLGCLITRMNYNLDWKPGRVGTKSGISSVMDGASVTILPLQWTCRILKIVGIPEGAKHSGVSKARFRFHTACPYPHTYPYIAHCMGACSAKGEWSLFSLSLSLSLALLSLSPLYTVLPIVHRAQLLPKARFRFHTACPFGGSSQSAFSISLHTWFWVQGSGFGFWFFWFWVWGFEFWVEGLWFMVYSLWCMVDGLWLMNYGLWFMDYCLLFIVYGLSFMV